MIEPRKDDEVKYEIHGYFYAKPGFADEMAQALTLKVFRPMAKKGKLHNVLFKTQQQDWDTSPIFENEDTDHSHRDDGVRMDRLNKLERQSALIILTIPDLQVLKEHNEFPEDGE